MIAFRRGGVWYPEGMDAALFVPCYIDLFYSRVGLAAAEFAPSTGAAAATATA